MDREEKKPARFLGHTRLMDREIPMTTEEFNRRIRGFTIVVRLDIQADASVGSYSLVLDLVDNETNGAKTIRATFADVSRLSIAGFGGGLSQFLHLRAEDCRDRQLDRMSYRIVENERDAMSFYCSSIDIEQ